MKNNSTRKFYDEAFTEIFSNRKITESLLKILNEGSDIDFVSRITGLTEKEYSNCRIIPDCLLSSVLLPT